MNKIEQKNTLKNSGFKSQATLLSTLPPQNFAITLQSKHVLHFSSPRYSRALESKFSNHKNKALEAKIKMLIKKRFGKDYLFPELFSKSPRSRIFSSPLNNKSREAMMKISNVYQKPLTSYHKNGFSSISKPVIFTERESKDFKSINSDINENKQSIKFIENQYSIKSGSTLYKSPVRFQKMSKPTDPIIQRREQKVYTKFVRGSTKLQSPCTRSSRYSNTRNSKCQINSPFSVNSTTHGSKRKGRKSKAKLK